MTKPSLHHNKAQVSYSGLTIILDKPSRHDTLYLIGGFAEKSVLYPAIDNCPFIKSRYQIEFISVDMFKRMDEKLREGTKAVLLCGPLAHKLVSPQSPKLKLNDSRGNIYTKDGIVYISTYFPQDCVDFVNYEDTISEAGADDSDAGKEKDNAPTRRKNYRYWFHRDFEKATKFLAASPEKPELYQAINNFTYDTYPVIEDCLQELHNLPANAEVTFDIETGPNYCLTCFGYHISGSSVIRVVPFMNYRKELCYDRFWLGRFIQAVQAAFRRRDVTFILHNSLFDLFVLSMHYSIVPPHRVFDTMVCRHRLEPEVEKSLGHCVSEYLFEESHKQDGLFEPKSYQQDEQLRVYNARDVATTRLIYKRQQEIVAARGLEESVASGNSLIRPYLLQSLYGLKVDTNLLQEEKLEHEKLLKQLQRVLTILIGYPLNPNSPKQVAEYLYTYKGLKKPAKDITSSSTLYGLLVKKPMPALRVILRMREVNKELGYMKFAMFGLKRDQINRFIHSSVPTGAKTFRLASRKVMGTWGGNIQNRKKKGKQIFIADEGKILVQSDQSGAEAVVMAYLAPYGRTRELVEHKIKAHVYIGLHMFPQIYAAELGISREQFISRFTEAPINDLCHDKDWPELKKLIAATDHNPGPTRYYFMQKKTVHASNYGMGWLTFRTAILKETQGAIVLEAKQAKYLLDTFHQTFPEVHRYHVWVKDHIHRTRELTNLWGDKRRFYGVINEGMYKDGYSWIPQSTVGMITNRAVAALQDKIDNAPAKSWLRSVDILNNVHDSMLSQTYPEHVDKLITLQESLMAVTLKTQYGEFTMGSSSEVGYNWYEMEERKV